MTTADEGEMIATKQRSTADRSTFTPAPGTTSRLTCQAPHPVISVAGAEVRCGSFLGYVPGTALFVETAPRAPDTPDAHDLWTRCGNKRCRAWNRFRLVEEAAA